MGVAAEGGRIGSRKDINRAVRDALTRLVLEAPENKLADFDGLPIFSSPAVGVADGDDPLFRRLREIVSERHFLPREVLAAHAPPGWREATVRVVAWALPYTEAVRRSNHTGKWPSKLYSLARNNGGALNRLLRDRFTSWLRAEGWPAVAPACVEEYDSFRCAEHVFASTWSERHVAYAAGLGQFGLNAALITPVGINVRLGSVVTNAPVTPTPRGADDYRAPCLASGGQVCGRCMGKCPVGAISSGGLDKEKCYAMRNAVRDRFMDEYVRALHMLPMPIVKSGRTQQDYSLGCALCQCGVPCEGVVPQFAMQQRNRDA